MVKLTINLRSKKLFFYTSAIILVYLMYHVTVLMNSIDITGLDIVIYYVLIALVTLCFWVPYEFTDKFS